MFEFIIPKDFVIGTANSAFQSEGAWDRDGKSETIIDHYMKMYAGKPMPYNTPGFSSQKHGGEFTISTIMPDKGCFFYDEYERYIEDMKKTGQDSYRMSICWSRIIPTGYGEVNQKGIDFYNRVFNKMQECGIKPLVDLYHWDLPQCLMEEGGFRNPKFPEWYENYARVCFENFGDRVKMWSTFNESCHAVMSGYKDGRFPPFEKSIKGGLLAGHNVILAHFRAVKLYHKMGLDGMIGCVNACEPQMPATMTQKDIDAAERRSLFRFDWWFGTMMEGKYPQRILDECPDIRNNMPENYQEDLDKYFEKMDFAGINFYYSDRVTEFDNDIKAGCIPNYHTAELTKFDHYPVGMIDALSYVTKRYGNDFPIYLSENGMGLNNFNNEEKDINDTLKVEFLREHFRMVVRCIRAGINLKGYYYWNDADSYEAMTAYEHRFGLTYVNHDTHEIKWKKSREYFSMVCKNRMVD